MSRKLRHDKVTRQPAARQGARGQRVGRLAAFVLREIGSGLAKIVSFTALAALFLLLLLDGSEIVLDRLDPRVETWISDRVAGPEVEVGSIGFSLGAGDRPAGITLNDIVVGETETSPELRVPSVETGFAVMDVIRGGSLQPVSVDISGTSLSVVQEEGGALRLFGNGINTGSGLLLNGTGGERPQDLREFLEALGNFDTPQMFGRLEQVNMHDVAFSFIDRAQENSWSTEHASMVLNLTETGFDANLRAELSPETGDAAAIGINLSQNTVSGTTRLAFEFDDARPRDVAALVPTLGWLGVIDAPIDGALFASLNTAGALDSLDGTLSLGPGALTPENAQPVNFTMAQLYFSFDPESEAFDVDALQISGPTVQVSASGRIQSTRGPDDSLAALVGELSLSDVHLSLPGLLASDLDYEDGELLARVSLAPFRVEIGSGTLRKGAERVSLNGTVHANEGHWNVAMDAQTTDLTLARGMSLWPPDFRPGVRSWITNHIQDGKIDQAHGFLRLNEGGREVGFDFDFSGGAFRPIKTMPQVVAARGTGQMIGDRFDIVLDRGVTGAGNGAGIDLSGSRMVIADTRPDPPDATFFIEAAGSAAQVLHLIDNEPLRLMSRAGQSPDFVRGRTEVAAQLDLPLKKRLRFDDVAAQVEATIFDMHSDEIVPDRVLAAEEIQVAATNTRLQIGGDVRLDGVPLSAFYERGFGAEASDVATVEGSLKVDRAALDGLRIPIQAGVFDGQTDARYALKLAPGAAPDFSISMPLAGTTINIPQLDWRKPRDAQGRLAVSGTLGDTPRIESLALSGPGLLAEGTLNLSGDAITAANFSRLRLGRWLDAPVRWEQSAGASKLAITGGTIDLRSGFGSGSGGNPLEISLSPDRIIVSDSIYLRGVSGQLTTQGGFRGRFLASVNGGADIEGVIRPGPEVFLSSSSGGQVLSSANIFSNARGGVLRARFKPVEGGLTGAFSLQDTRVRDAPVLAEILNLASVIGIADRLNGPGIGFEDVQGRFSIAPGRIRLSNARAVGASLGVTLEGVYDSASDQLAMEGVVSPLYMVNGLAERIPILGRLLGGRPGEGLLGANFRLSGDIDDPQVSVNPLSMLTPGAAREIFQSPSATGQ